MTHSRENRSVAHRSLTFTMLCLLGACRDAPPPAQCQDIPTAGCPEDNGADACSDVTCAAVYACQDGTWVFRRTCPDYSADAAQRPEAAPIDADSTGDAGIDAPAGASGGPGCADLQAPDCSLGAALACGGVQACCGCVDLYVCSDGGWDLWGACVDGGVTPQ
jgi:hypothetical protein